MFLETSAKTGLNIESLFAKAAKLLYIDYIKYNIGNPLIGKGKKEKDSHIKIKKGTKKHKDKEKSKCC